MRAFRGAAQRGFSLVEVLIAGGIVLAVTAAACGFAVEAQGVWRVEDQRMALQQRVRVAADVLTRALLEAGAGVHGGPASGPLLRAVPAIVPRRMGVRGADSPGVFRTDAFTVFRAATDAEPATLLNAVGPSAPFIEVEAGGCLLPTCGIREGSAVMLLDGAGSFDVFTVTAVAGAVLDVRHHGAGNAAFYPAGSAVVSVEPRTMYLDARTHTLRAYDDDASEGVSVDEVVSMEVEYYGDVMPPLWPRPASGVANCLYDAGGAYQSGSMPPLGGSPLPVRLPSAMLTDGPWCGTGDTRFDADLLRIRRVVVAVRLQASDAAVRGSDPARFRQPGTARQSGRMVADVVWSGAVAPRNLRQGW